MAKKTITESLKEVLKPVDVQETVTDEKVPAVEEVTPEPVDETTAADSLHPAARAIDNPKSKLSTIASAIGAMHAMSSDELTKWYTSSIANIGKEGDGVPTSSDTNQNSLNMKGSAAVGKSEPHTKDAMPKLGVKEDVEEMLAGYEISEEAAADLTVIVEAAVTARVILEQAKLEEQYEEKLGLAIEEFSEELTDRIDNYLTYVVEHFMQENEVAVESSLRNELMDEFISGMKNLFKEHYIDVPESKVDVVEALSDKVTELEDKFDEAITENVQLRESLVEVQREKLVDSFLEDLALSEADKFLKLVEGVDFTGDLELYSKKLAVVKENYFPRGNKKVPAGSTNIEEETFEGVADSKVSLDPTIARYMAAIDRNLK